MNTIRRCVDCNAHEAIPDGNRCRDCLNAYLRATRPAPVSPWVQRVRDGRGVAKVFA